MAVPDSSAESRAAPAAAASLRVQVARVALGAALTVDGVASGSSGRLGLRVTRSGTERLVGVVCAADALGGYAVALHLVVSPVPLDRLAERIRARVRARIAAAGMSDELARIDIVFEDLATGEGP